MPELPEVETAVRLIKKELSSRVIESVVINDKSVVASDCEDDLAEKLTGAKITSISRKGKFVNLTINDEMHLLIHFRMTGALFIIDNGSSLPKYTRICFNLENGKTLCFTDPRRFGKVWLVKDASSAKTGVEKLGADALNDEVKAETLRLAYNKSSKAIKTCLMEQTVVCGIGNIYSDEILFYCNILPYRKAKDITPEEWDRLAKAIKTVISYYTEKNAITPEDYLISEGRSYRNTPYLNVYGRKGKACRKCGTSLNGISIANRSSVYCPQCQK